MTRLTLLLLFQTQLWHGISANAQEHRVKRVSELGMRRPAEVTVAINPLDTDNVVAASMAGIASRPPRTSNFLYISTNGGKKWKTKAAASHQKRTQGDDALSFGADGTLYHSYISFSGLRQRHPKRFASGIFVNSSGDGGRKWDKPVAVVDHDDSITPFEDKPYLAVDKAAASPFKNHVYVAWTRFAEYGSRVTTDSSQIFIARSDDRAKSFSAPLRISDRGGDCLDGNLTVEGAVPAVGPAGQLYVTWAGPRGLEFDKSLDGGLTFGRDKVVARNAGGWVIEIDGINRHNGLRVTGADISGGQYRGSIYVNWIDQRFGDPDIFIAYSRDQGETWSAPVRVNNDTKRNGKAQFFTWMAVDPVSGSINIVFYDRRNLDGTDTGVTLARSIDGGQTFKNFSITIQPFSCNPAVFFGDYLGVDAHGGRVVAAFQHFVTPRNLEVSAAIFDFNSSKQETR